MGVGGVSERLTVTGRHKLGQPGERVPYSGLAWTDERKVIMVMALAQCHFDEYP